MTKGKLFIPSMIGLCLLGMVASVNAKKMPSINAFLTSTSASQLAMRETRAHRTGRELHERQLERRLHHETLQQQQKLRRLKHKGV